MPRHRMIHPARPDLTSLPAGVGDRQLAELWNELCVERRRAAALEALVETLVERLKQQAPTVLEK